MSEKKKMKFTFGMEAEDSKLDVQIEVDETKLHEITENLKKAAESLGPMVGTFLTETAKKEIKKIVEEKRE